MNIRFWLVALADPNKIAAQVLTTSPMKVRTLGLIRESASQRTMVSSRTPRARPKALVQLLGSQDLGVPEVGGEDFETSDMEGEVDISRLPPRLCRLVLRRESCSG